MGFGFAALIAGPVMQHLTAAYGLVNNFLIMGCTYFVIMCASASYLRPPRKGELEQSLEDVLKEEASRGNKRTMLGPQMTRREALHTWKFYALWWIFFTNITCGYRASGSSFAYGSGSNWYDSGAGRVPGRDYRVVNGGGRIVWSTVSDWTCRGVTYLVFFALEVAAFYARFHYYEKA